MRRLVPLLSLLALSARAPDELGERLAALSAPSAAVREEAEAWLARHLAPEDFPRLAQAAGAGDAEVLGRLARALAQDDRHLALCVRLAREDRRALSELGAGALEDLVLRWNPALSEPPLTGTELARRLERLARRGAAPPVALDLARPLEESLGLLRRQGALPLAVVADPALLTRPPDARLPARTESGAWDALLVELAREHAVGLEGHGLGTLEEPAAPGLRWLCFTPLSAAGSATGARSLVDWCLRVADGRTEARRREAARALAAAGWPAALGWLEERWLAQADEVALDALVLAASTGRVVPSLARPAGVRALCARADRSLGASEPDGGRLSELAWALGEVGCLAGAPSEDGDGTADRAGLIDLLLEGWAQRSERERWWRLVVLERAACPFPGAAGAAGAAGAPGAPEAAAQAELRELLADARTTPELGLQALRAWCAATAGDAGRLALAEPLLVALVRGALARDASSKPGDADRTRELLALLERAGCEPPAAWESAPPLEAAPFVAAWWLVLERAEPAARALALALGAPPTAGPDSPAPGTLALLLGELAARGFDARLREALERLGSASASAAGGGPQAADVGAAARELALRLGLLGEAELRSFLERRGPLESLSDPLLGAWAVFGPPPGDEEARELLLLRFQSALQADAERSTTSALVTALQNAVTGLFARGEDPAAERLVARLRRFLEGQGEARLARELVREGFPAPPRATPRPLSRSDRRLVPDTLGR